MRSTTTGIVVLLGSSFCIVGAAQSQPGPPQSEVAPRRVVGLRYPNLAQVAAVQGSVELQATISSDGVVTDVRVISGQPLLVDPATATLRKWLFRGCHAKNGCQAAARFIFKLSTELCDLPACYSEFQFDSPATLTITSDTVRPMIN